MEARFEQVSSRQLPSSFASRLPPGAFFAFRASDSLAGQHFCSAPLAFKPVAIAYLCAVIVYLCIMAESRSERLKYLSELLAAQHFSSQHQVVLALRRKGLSVTQASISRDFAALSVVKIGGRYLPAQTVAAEPSLYKRFITSLQPAGSQLLVIKTVPGAANTVAEAIDRSEIKGMVGSVAGDNTIFIATVSKAAQSRVAQAVRCLR